MESKKCKKYFKKFVDKWNNNDLNEIFYDSNLLFSKYADLIQTKHNWNIKLSDTERENVQNV